MERKSPPTSRRHGRIVDLPKPDHPRRLCLMEGSQLLELEAPPELLAGGVLTGFALGDLVAFQLDDQGRVGALERQGGPPEGQWDEAGDGLRWRRPGEPASRMAFLRLRGRILQEIRGYFDGEGFLEVDTPALVHAPTPEPQFVPLSVNAVAGVNAVTGGSAVAGAGGGYLITSPEFQLKRLLVGGFEKIYRLGPVFRGGEAGERHNPEFTMLEWYRTQTDLEAMAQDLEALLGRLAPLARPTDTGAGRGPELPGNPALAPALEQPFKRSTVGALLKHHLGIHLNGVTTAPALREAALAAKVPGAGQLPDDFERAFFTLWDRIEQSLGPEPLLVGDWPAPLASLARLKPGEPTLAERMELYAGGYELANGFAELTDAAEQRRRFEADLAARKALGLPALPLDERFLEALASGMPPASGMALGVERLVMLIGGAKHIRQVMPFTADEL